MGGVEVIGQSSDVLNRSDQKGGGACPLGADPQGSDSACPPSGDPHDDGQ
jgi:hypothetical protein